MHGISAFIIIKNKNTMLEKAINSLKQVADDVIIVSSATNDNISAIANDLDATLVYTPRTRYDSLKLFAENLCKHNWILNIYANEELSQELQDEISYIFTSDNFNDYLAYNIKFKLLYWTDIKPSFFALSRRSIRLYNRQFTSSMINYKEKIYDLDAVAHSYIGASINRITTKINLYFSR